MSDVAGRSSDAANQAPGRFQYRLRTLLLVVTLWSVVFSFIGWRLREPDRQRQRGRRIAEEDWDRRDVVLFVNDASPYRYYKSGYAITYNYDVQTGLPLYPIPRLSSTYFFEGYNTRVRELTEQNGACPSALNGCHVRETDLIAAMTRKDFTPVVKFPHDVTPKMVLFQRGSITRPWGTTSAPEMYPNVTVLATPHYHCNFVGENEFWIGQMKEHPGLVFIRDKAAPPVIYGTGVQVFDMEGRELCRISDHGLGGWKRGRLARWKSDEMEPIE